MSSLSYIILEPTDAEVDVGIIKVHKMSNEYGTVHMESTKKGVAMSIEITLTSREDLDKFAKVLATAWQEHTKHKQSMGFL